jgi:hypothetical protein
VYEWLPEKLLVANCHKVPAKHFTKRLLSVEEIVESFEQLPQNIKIVLTVSPVRHTKDTLPLNAVSKAVLRLACHQLAQKHPHVYYFPSYEIVTDELRDYRFYEADMLHPSAVAVDYIWRQFVTHCFAPDAQTFIDKWAKIQKALQHRPLQPNTEARRHFLQDLLRKLEGLRLEANVETEIESVKAMIGHS